MLRLAVGLSAALALGATAFAHGNSILGTWTSDTGATKINFAPCGDAICGTISWLKDTRGKAKVSPRVFTGLNETAPGTYSGTAIDPEDGKQYTGSITVEGNSLSGGGWVLGGLI